jgi:parvulin-like peptidyl-prolyl isomerase
MPSFSNPFPRCLYLLAAFALVLATAACGQTEQDTAYGIPEGEEDQVFDREGDFAGSHILVAYDGAMRADPSITRTKEEALAKAQDLIARLNDGANFAELAREESDGPSGTLGGDLGAWTKGRMVPAFDAAVETMEIGDVTQEPVETDFGYHVIRREPLGALYYGADIFFVAWEGTVAADRLPEPVNRDSAAAAALADSIGQALTEATFDDLAEEYNDLSDKAEALPIFVRNDPSVPEEVKGALQTASIGDVVGPVTTPYGFAFLRRTRVEQYRGAHILLDHSGAPFPNPTQRTPEEARELAVALIDSLQADPTRFAELSRAYSADQQRPEMGGDLGPWFKGAIMPEFEEAIDGLSFGELHPEPVETVFGYHVIMRLDPKVPLVPEAE